MLPDDFAEKGIYIRRVSPNMPVMYQVIGERASGTNIIRKMLFKNLRRMMRTECLGWKHGFPRMLAIPENMITFVCVRDARKWGLSMHKRPWHAHPQMQQFDYSDFIRARWHSIVDRVSDFETIHPELEPEAPGRPLQFDRHPVTGLPFANLYDLRRAKLEGHLSMLYRGGDVVVLRMESFLSEPDRLLNEITEAFGLERKADYVRETHARLGNRFTSTIRDRPETPEEMSAEDIDFMKSQLNLCLERQLGYDYG